MTEDEARIVWFLNKLADKSDSEGIEWVKAHLGWEWKFAEARAFRRAAVLIEGGEHWRLLDEGTKSDR